MRTKIMKRIVTLVLALAMVCTTSAISSIGTLAEDYGTTPEITIVPAGTTLTPNTPAVAASKKGALEKRFVAYQVFSGSVTATNDELDNVDWGNALVISDDTDMNAKYAAVKTLMNKLATTDWDGNPGTTITIDSSGAHYSPDEAENDQAGRAFVHIYEKIMKAITEAKGDTEKIKNAARAAAQEVAQVLDGSYSEDGISVAKLFKDAKGDAVTSYMQKFAQAVKDTVTDSAYSVNYVTTGDATDKYRKYESTWVSPQWKITGIPAGYYFIDDTIALDADLKGDAVSPYMLDVFKSVPVTIKSDAPKLDKTITRVTDLAGDGSSHVSGTNMSATADIGDTVTYQLVGTLPKNLGTFYDSYKYVFTDTLSKGLTCVDKNNDTTVDANDVTVEIALNLTHDQWITVTPNDKYYTVALNHGSDNSNILTITFANLIDYFKATIDGYAIDRRTSNEYRDNVIYDFANIKWENVQIRVTYSATVNKDAAVGITGNPNTAYLTYSNNPNVESDATSTTVEKQPKVYTFQLELNKIDDENTPLSGAKFTMSKLVGAGRKYAQFEEQSADSYIITGWVDSASGGNTTFTTAGKNVVIKGLDEGTYRLEETEAPAGYDKVDPFEVRITAGKADEEYNGTIENGMVTFPDNKYPDGDAKLASGFEEKFANGEVVLDVTDMKASVLPHTGGSGVYFYYIAGGVLVAAALVLLVVSRRRSKRSA